MKNGYKIPKFFNHYQEAKIIPEVRCHDYDGSDEKCESCPCLYCNIPCGSQKCNSECKNCFWRSTDPTAECFCSCPEKTSTCSRNCEYRIVKLGSKGDYEHYSDNKTDICNIIENTNTEELLTEIWNQKTKIFHKFVKDVGYFDSETESSFSLTMSEPRVCPICENLEHTFLNGRKWDTTLSICCDKCGAAWTVKDCKVLHFDLEGWNKQKPIGNDDEIWQKICEIFEIPAEKFGKLSSGELAFYRFLKPQSEENTMIACKSFPQYFHRLVQVLEDFLEEEE